LKPFRIHAVALGDFLHFMLPPPPPGQPPILRLRFQDADEKPGAGGMLPDM
jgi:hypothetical protein